MSPVTSSHSFMNINTRALPIPYSKKYLYKFKVMEKTLINKEDTIPLFCRLSFFFIRLIFYLVGMLRQDGKGIINFTLF